MDGMIFPVHFFERNTSMKKALSLLLIALLLVGCAEPNNDPPKKEQVTELSDVTYETASLKEEGFSLATLGTEPNSVTKAVTWVANELVLNAQAKYKKPLLDCDLTLVLTNGTDTYRVPGFWDGDNVWRVRFVCPAAGTWTYETECSNTADAGLNGVKGTIECTAYTGKLAIYQHGFVKTDKDKRCFTYADGTPFFYLGDTHWNFGAEPTDLVTKMAQQRQKQGFTVIQTEPLGTTFTLSDGISLSKSDFKGFAAFDELFQIVADRGLVNANAEFFFPSYMELFIGASGGYDMNKLMGTLERDGKTYQFYDLADKTKECLKAISRYWVARYGAYPVFWTLGQEVDSDNFWSPSNHKDWSSVNNPYKYVADYVSEADAYQQPLTAHMIHTRLMNSSKSVFRDVASHSWWAVQWSQNYNVAFDPTELIDFYNLGQGKPIVLYESKYCYLETKNFGARVQGWAAFLSGMCGYGWGGQDTWDYLATYIEDSGSGDGVDHITPKEKQDATYEGSLEFPSTYQVGYMRAFFETIVDDWYDLVPRWNDDKYLTREPSVLALCASTEDMEKIVCYFYQTHNTDLLLYPNAITSKVAWRTGTLGKLTPNAAYGYVWFDPVNGKTTGNGEFTADGEGKWYIGDKADSDMVLYVYKK